ncbi:MAG TPA: hypothetical protein VGM05_27170 [Planctomycetaceae bacterium]
MKLRQWYQVHGAIEVSPHPTEMLEWLRPQVPGLGHDFEIREGHWYAGSFRMFDASVPANLLHRWRPGEAGFLDIEGIENYVNGLPDEPHRDDILRKVRQTRQTVSLRGLATFGASRLARICEQLCGHLARVSDGIIQVHQDGFFSPMGESLFPHSPRHRLKTR